MFTIFILVTNILNDTMTNAHIGVLTNSLDQVKHYNSDSVYIITKFLKSATFFNV